jgi:hypothetical protein
MNSEMPPFARYVTIVASLTWDPPPRQATPGPPVLGTFCRHGHEWTPENTAIGKDGKRDCRACARVRWHRRQAELRAMGAG